MEIKPGIYRHYKGKEYEVLGVGKHTETLEDLVFYRSLYGDKSLWVRPVGMFFGVVDGSGRLRFTYIKKK